MAYYAALVSLKLTIKRLLESPKVSFLPPCQEISEFAYEEIGFLQQVLYGSEEQLLKNSPREVIALTEFKTAQEQPLKMLGYADKEVGSLQKVLDRLEEQLLKNSTREEVVALTGQIRDAACKLEDSLEFHLSDQFFSRSESLGGGCPVILSPDTEEVKQRIDYIKETMEKLEKMIQELRNALPEEDCVVSPNIHFGGEGSKMVGFSDLFHEIKRRLGGPGKTSIWGMAGSGKSKLAEEIYKDQLDFKHFECCAWITIGPEHQLKKVFLHDKLHEEGYEILVEELHTSLSGRKYLIVVDDIWSQQDWDELKSLLPDNTQRHVLFTTRLRQIRANVGFGMCFLTEEESWDLLRQKMFGEECLCPFELEKAGREIAKKCECLPLTIVTIANILSKSEKTSDYWNKVAEKKNSIFKDTVFTEAYEQMSKVLFPSYKYLPQHLKALFLYTAVFPPSSKIRASKLLRLWNVEGFLEPKYKQGYSSKKEKEYAMELLRHLVDSSVVLPGHWLLGEMKSWSLCSPFWYLCAREARKEKLFHVLDTYPNSFNEGVESQRRFCILNNTLLGIKDVHNSIKSNTTVHSLLCTDPKHCYPVPLFTGLKLLRVLDALAIRFYHFPNQVLKSIHLRYLALTYGGNVPASISKLWNLQYLIVRQHMNIKNSSRDQSYLPIAIWGMQELKHLQIMGSNLPEPYVGALLPNLLSLLDISVKSCEKRIFGRLPMLKKLGVRIELVPDDAEPMYPFDHLSVLRKLESFKCVIVNPNFSRSQIVSPPTHFKTFPICLRKLSLSGFGYPWESIRVIAQLPKLEVLKLRCYAFRGPEWVIHRGEFKKLRFLLLEDADLVHWEAPFVTCQLIIRHCYKLTKIPRYFYETPSIEVVDCPSIVDSLQRYRKENFPGFPYPPIHCSWNEEKPTL